MEDNLNIDELGAILDAARKREFERQKFAAALKGVDLGESQAEQGTSFEEVKARAKAQLEGKTEDEISFGEMGFAVEVE